MDVWQEARRGTQCRHQEANDRRPGDSNAGPDEGFICWTHIHSSRLTPATDLWAWPSFYWSAAWSQIMDMKRTFDCPAYFPSSSHTIATVYIFHRSFLFTFCQHCIRKDEFTLHNSLRPKVRNVNLATRHFPLVFDEGIFHCFIFYDRVYRVCTVRLPLQPVSVIRCAAFCSRETEWVWSPFATLRHGQRCSLDNSDHKLAQIILGDAAVWVLCGRRALRRPQGSIPPALKAKIPGAF